MHKKLIWNPASLCNFVGEGIKKRVIKDNNIPKIVACNWHNDMCISIWLYDL
jgi:hypothetical protein